MKLAVRVEPRLGRGGGRLVRRAATRRAAEAVASRLPSPAAAGHRRAGRRPPLLRRARRLRALRLPLLRRARAGAREPRPRLRRAGAARERRGARRGGPGSRRRGRDPRRRRARAPARVRQRRPRPARVERSQPLGAADARALRGAAAPGGARRRPGEVDRALELVGGWLESDLRASLGSARASGCGPRRPSCSRSAAASCAARWTSWRNRPAARSSSSTTRPTRSADSDPASHAERYATQRGLYALAASRLGGDAGPVRTAYCFLEAPGRPRRAQLRRGSARRRPRRRRAADRRRAAAEFEVTPTPHAALCHDCPARLRLCSYDEEMTMRRIDP